MQLNFTIPFKEGFHSRPAINLTDLCKEYKNIDIYISKVDEEEKHIKCKNLIAILTANIQYKSSITINVEDSKYNEMIQKRLNEIFKETEH